MPKKQSLSFEEAMNELEEILEEISAEETTLDASIGLYARAAELIKQSHNTLIKAQIKVDEINVNLAETGTEE